MARFGFFDVVKIVLSAATRGLGVAGRNGVVLGVAEEPESGVWYAVEIDGTTYSIAEEDLESTGRRLRWDDIYDGSCLRVNIEGTEIGEPDG